MASGSTINLKIKLIDEATGAVRNITGQFEGLEEVLSRAKRRAEDFDLNKMFKFNLVGQSLNQISSSLADMIAPSKEFDSAMRKANTMAGLNEEQFQAMKKSIRELSQEIPMSAAALSEGLYAVVSNGFDASEQLEVLKASARSAVGGCADLSSVIGVTATMIKNYGLSGAAAVEIQDKIQLTAKNGVTSFEELAGSLPMVSGSAATLGVSIDELMASFSTLTGVSGNTANVATQMGAVFNSLISPTSEASKTAKALGIEFNAAAIKSAGGLQQFLKNTVNVVQAYCQKTGELEAEVYGQLFGNARALRALIPLTGELADKYSTNVSAMVNSTGTMDAAFDQMSQTAEARAQARANSIGGFTDFVMEKLGGAITASLKATSTLASISSAMPALKVITKSVFDFGRMFAHPLASVRLMTMRLRAMRVAIMRTAAAQRVAAVATKIWTGVQKVFNVIASMNPIGLIVLGIMALIGVVYLVIEAFKKWGDEALMLFGPLGSMVLAFKTHWDSIVDAFKNDGILAGLKRIRWVLWDALLRPVQKLLGWVGELTGWDWAKKAANWVQEVRIDHNLAKPEETKATDNKTAETKADKKKEEKKLGPLGINKSTDSTASKATAQSSQIKRIDIRIDKVVEQFTVQTTNMQQAAGDIRDMVARALVDAVNDVNYAL